MFVDGRRCPRISRRSSIYLRAGFPKTLEMIENRRWMEGDVVTRVWFAVFPTKALNQALHVSANSISSIHRNGPISLPLRLLAHLSIFPPLFSFTFPPLLCSLLYAPDYFFSISCRAYAFFFNDSSSMNAMRFSLSSSHPIFQNTLSVLLLHL